MPKREELDSVFLEVAESIAKLSKAERKKVGAILVKDENILSIGYNGTPSGHDNVCEHIVDGKMVTKPSVLHAETNAITKIARSTQSSEGSTLYQTLSPCYECAKLIHQSGVKRVVFTEIYRLTDGLEFLNQSGIELDMYTKIENDGDVEYVHNRMVLDKMFPPTKQTHKQRIRKWLLSLNM